ncbi:MAG: hypothetical protein ACXABK_04950 [Candidatus Heimdallarchaeaceae archaeon]|jgi:hypothetical protein
MAAKIKTEKDYTNELIQKNEIAKKNTIIAQLTAAARYNYFG